MRGNGIRNAIALVANHKDAFFAGIRQHIAALEMPANEHEPLCGKAWDFICQFPLPHRDMVDRAHRGTERLWRIRVGAAFAKQQPGSAHRIGRAQDRSKVARILYAVESDDQPRRILLRKGLLRRFHRGADPLRRSRLRQAFHHAAAHEMHVCAAARKHCGHRLMPLFHESVYQLRAGKHGFPHKPFALDEMDSLFQPALALRKRTRTLDCLIACAFDDHCPSLQTA